jgi:hypothetical protein
VTDVSASTLVLAVLLLGSLALAVLAARGLASRDQNASMTALS